MRFFKFAVFSAVSIIFVTIFANRAAADTFVFAHALEVSGRITNTQNTFDTTFFITYTGGLLDGTIPGSATVDFYIFDDMTGQPLKSATNIDVCNPCSFSPNAANRKGIGNIEGIANSVGGLPRPNVTASMIFVVSGDSANVDIGAFVFNSHTSPNDISVFSLDVQPIDDSYAPSFSRTETIAYWREDSMMNDQPFSFSQDLHVYYAGGLPGTSGASGATVNLRLYDETTGMPLQSAMGSAVCNPCAAALSTIQRKRTFSFDQLIRDAGGFPRTDVRGFATIELSGDIKNVSLQSIAKNNHTSANDAEFSNTGGLTLSNDLTVSNGGATLAGPLVIEKQGTADLNQFTFDTNLEVTYTGGLPGLPSGSGATVDFFLFDQATGLPMTNHGISVCNPCAYNLSPGTRKVPIMVDDLITRNGTVTFDQDFKRGFGIIVVGGTDPENVAVQGFVVNSHTGPLDLSVFGFEPEALRPAESNRRVLDSEYTYSHFRERAGRTDTTTFTFDTEFHASYHGRQSATLDLYLYDENTSMPLRSLTNMLVCNPCSFVLNGPQSVRQIKVDDLITAAGGFPRADLGGYAKIKVTGDAGNVAVLGTLVNSHSGPNDLSTTELPRRLSARRTTDFDFDGDGRADIGVFRPSEGNWYLTNSSNNQFRAFNWGLDTDKIAPADYDGDGKADFAVWRPTGMGDPDRSYYYMFLSTNSTVRIEQFGRSGDRPVVGDWDGDGTDDLAVYRAGSGPGEQSTFFHRPSSNPSADFLAFGWGLGNDIPVAGDWDGDGRADPAVFRPSEGVWYIHQSESSSLRAERWGLATDVPVPGDFDGDGKKDLAVWRPSSGTWYISQSSNGGIRYLNWGISSDLPVPADYDGDGRADIGVWRPSNGIWYMIESSNNRTTFTPFGQFGDSPIPCFGRADILVDCVGLFP